MQVLKISDLQIHIGVIFDGENSFNMHRRLNFNKTMQTFDFKGVSIELTKRSLSLKCIFV